MGYINISEIMQKEDEILKKRLIELAERSYQNNIYTFTDFLGIADINIFYENENLLRYAGVSIWGGNEICERKLIRFGDKGTLMYEEEFPIVTLIIRPLMAKFADELTHRDILGALMNLGIERGVIGDIFLNNNCAYVFCLKSIAEYICDSLSRVKHTTVLCKVYEDDVSLTLHEYQEMVIQISSERIDGVIAKSLNLSRSQVIPLFKEKKVYVNGRLMENLSHILKNNDIITVRGFGRILYHGVSGTSKKGKLIATISK